MSLGYCQSLSRFYVKLQIYEVGIDQMTKHLLIFPLSPIRFVCACSSVYLGSRLFVCMCVHVCRGRGGGFWQLVYICEWAASAEWVIVHLVFGDYCVANPVTWDCTRVQMELI